MYPAKFDYYRASSVDEALALLQEHGEEAKLLAGGHSLLPMMKLRLAQPPVLIDLGGAAELKGVRREGGGVTIGAMTTYREIVEADTGFAALTDVCSIMGDMQVRNRGTIGGNLAHNDPSGDLPAVALALEVELQVRGPDGERTIPAEEFIVGLMETALQPGEIVTAVRFADHGTGKASAYEKAENPASGYAICGVCAALQMDGDTIRTARVAVTGAAEHAQRLHDVEAALEGQAATAESFAAAAENAGDGLDYMADIHADEAYRAHLVKVLTRRALEKAAGRG